MLRLALAILMLAALGRPVVYGATPSLDEILAKVAEADMTSAADVLGFQQKIELRALLFRWYFSVDVIRDDTGLRATVGHGAPSFMPADLPTSLMSLASELSQFDLTLVGTETAHNGGVYYIIEGKSREGQHSGAQSGRIWVDGSDWYIARAHMAYTWGRLEVEQEYRVEQGRRVLHRQSAVARPLGARLEVEYVGTGSRRANLVY